MEYIKNPMKIEDESFKIIQSIIDEQRENYQFKNEFEAKNLF